MYLKTKKSDLGMVFWGVTLIDKILVLSLHYAPCSFIICNEVKVKNVFSLNEPDDLQQFVIIKRGNRTNHYWDEAL